MPKQRKLSTSELSTANVKDLSDDTCEFWHLFSQSKVIISNHLKNCKVQSDWLQDFLQDARDRIENVQKDSASDISQQDGVGDPSKKDSDQAVLSSQENGGTRKRRKKRSSKLRKSSAASRKGAHTKSSIKKCDDADLDEEKENINVNNSSKTESDASQDIIEGSPLSKTGGDVQLNIGPHALIKEKDPVVVLGPFATSDESSGLVTQNYEDHHTFVARLTNEVQEKTEEGVNSIGMKNPVVVLESLTNGKPRKSNHCTVSESDCDQTSFKKKSQGNELKTTRTSSIIKCRASVDHTSFKKLSQKSETNRTSSTIKCRDSVVVLEPLSVTQCRELGESIVRNRTSGKRKLTEVICESSHLESDSDSSASKTPRRSSQISIKNRHSKESLEPVSKMPKLSHSEKCFSSEESDDNKRNKISKPPGSDSDSGTYCFASGGSDSGSKRSNTSISSSSAKESFATLKSCLLQSVKKNGQLNRQRSQDSIGYKTPESSVKRDFNNSALRLQYCKSMLSQSRTTPKSTFVFSSSKAANQLSRSKLISGCSFTKPCTPLHSMNTSILKSRAAVHEAEKEKYKQEEVRRQQEKEQALLKKHQLLQMRVEEQKRKREARMQKNLEARLQLDREKAERHKVIEQKEKKISNTAKEKVKETKKNRLKADPLEDHASTKKLCSAKPADKILHTPMDAAKMPHREVLSAKPVVSVVKHTASEAVNGSEDKSLKQSETQAAVLNSTFVKNDETSCESYEMTPARPRSTYCNYDISELKSDDDSEDECAPSKPIPSWAVGMRFKQALISQHHNPPDLDELFGGTIVPNLSEMFATKKPRYLKRTSSAIWNTPDKIVFAVKSYS